MVLNQLLLPTAFPGGTASQDATAALGIATALNDREGMARGVSPTSVRHVAASS